MEYMTYSNRMTTLTDKDIGLAGRAALDSGLPLYVRGLDGCLQPALPGTRARAAEMEERVLWIYCTLRQDAKDMTRRPSVGDACTVCYIADRHAATVIAVSPSGSKVTVQEDKATRTDGNGVSQTQIYTYERDPKGKVHVFYRRAHGYAQDGIALRLGEREEFYSYEY